MMLAFCCKVKDSNQKYFESSYKNNYIFSQGSFCINWL